MESLSSLPSFTFEVENVSVLFKNANQGITLYCKETMKAENFELVFILTLTTMIARNLVHFQTNKKNAKCVHKYLSLCCSGLLVN